MAQRLIPSFIPGKHLLFAKLLELENKKSDGGVAYYGHRAQGGIRELRAGPAMTGMGMCGVAFLPFWEYPEDTLLSCVL